MLRLKLCVFLAFLLLPLLTSKVVDALIPLPGIASEKEAQITLYNVSPADELSIYKYAYSTSNGINVQVAGSPLEQIGIYQYTAPDGTPFEVRYIADELGFHAVGRHLPRPPPIPDYILRSLEYIRTHPNAENRGRDRVWH